MKMSTTKFKIILAWFFVTIASRFVKLSFLIGSNHLILSGITATLPVAGFLFSMTQTAGIISLIAGFKYVTHGLPLTLWIPTLLATLSWSVSSTPIKRFNTFFDFCINVAFPLTCLVLFVTHPQGNQAFVYSFYWLLPPAIWALRATGKQHLFLISLQSTFVAHAAGSIIWLYTVPMSATQWTVLIPLVAIERLTIAGCSTLFAYGLSYLPRTIDCTNVIGTPRSPLA